MIENIATPAFRPGSSAAALCAAVLFGAGLFAAAPAAAQTKTFGFATGACDYTLRIDTKKVKQAELEATLKLLFDFNVVVAVVPDKAAGLAAETRRVEAECAASAKNLAGAKLLPDPRVEAIRRELVEADAEYCRYNRDKLAAWTDPERLRGWSREPKCQFYVDALAGTVPTEKAVDALVADSCKDNSDPKRCRADFVRDARNPDKHRSNLISFGWNNCVNPTTRQAKLDSDARHRLGTEFLKRYKVKESCEN